MQRFENILVCVDLSHADRLAASELNPPTLEAISRAIWLADQSSATLTFFAAIDISAQARELLKDEFARASQSVADAANEVLAELVSRAKQEGIEAVGQVEFGIPSTEIVRQVLREKHDLVIVGTRNLGSASRLLFGSTGMKLLRKCPCPVWVSKEAEKQDVANILISSDLSETSLRALAMTVDSGILMDARVHLLHAVDYPFDFHLWRTGLPDEKIEAYREKTRAEAEQQLHEQLSQTDYRTLTYGVQVHTVDGPADIAIVQAIEEYDIDLMVLGTVGRGGIQGMLIGNTAERIMRELTCSVLAVKPPDFESPVTLD